MLDRTFLQSSMGSPVSSLDVAQPDAAPFWVHRETPRSHVRLPSRRMALVLFGWTKNCVNRGIRSKLCLDANHRASPTFPIIKTPQRSQSLHKGPPRLTIPNLVPFLKVPSASIASNV